MNWFSFECGFISAIAVLLVAAAGMVWRERRVDDRRRKAVNDAEAMRVVAHNVCDEIRFRHWNAILELLDRVYALETKACKCASRPKR